MPLAAEESGWLRFDYSVTRFKAGFSPPGVVITSLAVLSDPRLCSGFIVQPWQGVKPLSLSGTAFLLSWGFCCHLLQPTLRTRGFRLSPIQ